MSKIRLFNNMGRTFSLGAFLALVAVAPAQALTLGNTSLPTGSRSVAACTSSGMAEIIQTTTDSSYHYAVPAGGGTINSWSFNTTGATANTPYELVIARNAGNNTYQVVATDTETVPANAPTIATFTIPKPILVQGGDVLGVVNHGSQNTVSCLFRGGSLNAGDTVGNGTVNKGSGNPPNGSFFPIQYTAANELVNVSADLVQSNDIAITQQVEPATVTAGSTGVFVLSVTSTGPSQTPVTLTDTVPTGLSIQSVSAGTAACSVSGQNISCTLSGAPAHVAIVVTAPAPGSYSNTAHAQGSLIDPNPANNTSTGKLTVAAIPPAGAVAPALSLWTWPLQSATAAGSTADLLFNRA